MKKQWTGTLAIGGALAIGLCLSLMPAAGQGGGAGAKGGKGGGGGGFGAFGKGGKKGGPTTRTPDGKPDMNGFWETRNFFTAYDLEEHKEAAFGVPKGAGVVVDPADGKIPYQPWAMEKKLDMVAHHLFEDPQAHCYLSGVPRQMYTPFGFQIIQTPTAVVLMYEAFHANRIIYLSGKHPGPSVKMFEGDSRGHWEGDTLVVDVTNQNDRTWFDMEANFHSPDVHVTERFTPVLDDSNTIHYEAMIEDPKVFTRPWKIAFDLGRNANPTYENLEYACVEGEQDLQHYTDGAGAAGINDQLDTIKKALMRLLPTTLVGSYPQPDWLINRDMLSKSMPPRVRVEDLWRVDPKWLELAQDDATLLALRDQERAGLDIVTDGEMRRESYSNRFATALEGLDLDDPGKIMSRSGHPILVPRVVGAIRRKHPVQVRDVQFMRANTDRMIKITVPGPFTMAQQAVNEHYPSEEALALGYAGAVNEEIKDMFKAGADFVQIDEPYMQAYPEKARQYGLAALNRALEGVQGKTVVHICFGYGALVAGRPAGYSFLPELEESLATQISIETAQSNLDCAVLEKLPGKTILLGVLDLASKEVETPETVAGRIRRALPHINPERLIIAPDCGMKYLPREVAFGKMKSMVAGAEIVRAELTGDKQGLKKSA